MVSDVSITITGATREEKLGGKGMEPIGVCCSRGQVEARPMATTGVTEAAHKEAGLCTTSQAHPGSGTSVAPGDLQGVLFSL